MRLGKIALAVSLGLALTARAEDNVMIDLSVLDSLGGSYMAPAEPLFPVLPKKPTPAPKKIKKKAKPVVAKPKSAKVMPKVEPIIEVKELEPVVVVDVEPLPEPVAKAENPIVREVVAEQPTEAPVVSEGIVASEAPVAPEQTPAEPEVGSQVEDALPIAEPAAEVPALLIDETALSENHSVDNSIVFAADVDELLPEQMAAIDMIIGRFKDANANKIAIYSYNLDDGVDSFRKKRLSLNRAVEIRSYLLKQGYKNFSIKVININADSDKINTVELEEI